MHIAFMKKVATFTARVLREGKWFVAFSPEFPEGNGQLLTEEEALDSLRESILLLMEDRREDSGDSAARRPHPIRFLPYLPPSLFYCS